MIANSSPIVPLIVCVTILVVLTSGAICFAIVWDKAPWWRAHPTPRRQVDDDKDAVRVYKIRRRHPEAFKEPVIAPPPD